MHESAALLGNGGCPEQQEREETEGCGRVPGRPA
jgi:hypothetical protein